MAYYRIISSFVVVFKILNTDDTPTYGSIRVRGFKGLGLRAVRYDPTSKDSSEMIESMNDYPRHM